MGWISSNSIKGIMAYTFSVNNQISTQNTTAYAMWYLISTLVTAGWTKVMDSDGTTYSSGGAQVTGPGTGTNGIDNANAWIRMQAPAVNGGSITNQKREFTFQRGSFNYNWRIKYSASTGFTTSPSASATPSSTDEVFMAGGGTDASPTFYSCFNDNTNPWRWHIVAGGAAEFYSFAAWGNGTTNATIGVSYNGIFLDVMASGSYSSLDVDPAVVYVSLTGTGGLTSAHGAFISSNQTNPALARAWLGPVSAAGASLTSNNVGVGSITYSAFNGASTFGTNPWTNKDDLHSIIWGNNSSVYPRGIKGISTLFKAGTIQRGQMVTCDTISAGSRDKIFLDRCWVPWSGALPII